MPRFIIIDKGTIRESRDQEESTSRSRKRQRVELEDDGLSAATGRDGPLVRDPEYYNSETGLEGMVVVRVKDVLFRVQKHLLLRSSTLDGLLALHGSSTSDETPLGLCAASVDGFRALLWALHAPPSTAQDHVENVDRLLSLATITAQYHLTSLHLWAISTIQEITSDAIFVETCSSATFTHIVDLAVESKQMGLLSSIVSSWSDRIFRRDIPSVPAILAADKHNLSNLRGVAYYAQIQEMTERQGTNTDGGATRLLSVDPKLSNGQVLRLLSGYWSLVSYLERLRRNPPKLVCVEGCSIEAHGSCVSSWEDRWHAAASSREVFGFHSADVLAILSCMRDQLGVDATLAQAMSFSCRMAAMGMVKKTQDSVREGLGKHFAGCI